MKKRNKVLLSLSAASGLIATGATNSVKADKITVKAGDTVSQLALDHSTTIENVQCLNNLEDVNFILIGQQLEMGNGQAVTTSYYQGNTQTLEQNTNVQENVSQTQVAQVANEVTAQQSQQVEVQSDQNQKNSVEVTQSVTSQTDVAQNISSTTQVAQENVMQDNTSTTPDQQSTDTNVTVSQAQPTTAVTTNNNSVSTPSYYSAPTDNNADKAVSQNSYATSPKSQSDYNYNNNYSKNSATNVVATANSNDNKTSSATDNEQAAKDWIANKESGGSYTARNGIYIGKYQLTASYLNGDYSAENQERVADNYVKNRYGSWTAAKDFWQKHNWY